MKNKTHTALPAFKLLWLTPFLLVIVSLFIGQSARAQDTDCNDASVLQHTFASGASWSACAHVSEVHGLEVSHIAYRAPGDSSRSVMASVNVAQILLHYHDKANAEPQFSPSDSDTDDSVPSQTLRLNERTCDGEILGTDAQPDSFCSRIKNNRILAKFGQTPSLQSEAWEVYSVMLRESLTWNISWTFTEDGQIRPRVSVSGRPSRTQLDSQFSQNARNDIPRLTRASVLATWRLVPAMDTDAPDRIEQFDFPLDVAQGNRRAMQITPITQEALLQVEREQFRGWRIIDTTGAGYYMDPANQGYSYASNEYDWANYDVAITRYDACEQYASGNITSNDNGTCGAHLNDYVNAESLTDEVPVFWYSQSRQLTPGIEDWPVLSDVQIGFDLLPFDWTATSPFEVVE